MKYIYFGSSHISCSVLAGLCRSGFIPSLVISQPDKPKGRGLKLKPTEVSVFSKENNIPLINPKNLKDDKLREELASQEADFSIVVDYGKILPSWILSIASKHCICLHPSLLPFYRGPAPIEYALMDGKSSTGVTVFVVNERVDSGDIILQKEVAIDSNDDFFSLSDRLTKEGCRLLIEAMDKISHDDYTLRPQDEAKATFTHKLKKEDGRINWKMPATDIRNLMRATKGWPSVYTYYKGIMLKVIDAVVLDEKPDSPPGRIIAVDKKGISVATAKGVLLLKVVQPQAKKEMSAWAFVYGHHLKAGEAFLNKPGE